MSAPEPVQDVARPERDAELTLEIDELAFGGQSVARHGRFVVFVDDGAPGDLVTARVRRARRRWAEADIVRVERPGPDRVEPPCPYVPACGGCRLQHVRYEATVAAKGAQIGEHLARIGHLTDVEVRAPESAISPFGYRNKMEYSAAPGPAGELVLGFHRRRRWDEVVDVADCLLATPAGNAVRETVRRLAVEVGLRPYDQRIQEGMLRHLVVREAITTGQLLVTIVTAPGCEEAVDALADPLMAAHPALVGLVHAVNDGVAEVTAGLPSRLVRGVAEIEERILGVSLRLSAGAFFQTNTLMAERLYEHVSAAAALTGEEVLYDLYAGAGSIGLVLAPRAKEVVSIELVPEAVADAQANAERNGLTNFRAVAGDVRAVLRERRAELPAPDVAIVDPPRGGLSGGAIRRLLELAPPTLVYVSCHPATFADNAARLVEGGYRLAYVQPVDMFPNTPHIEAVARFTRERSAAG